jgi:hypothetical protein
MDFAPNEFGLQRPSASGRPARRMNSASRGLRPMVGLRRPGRGFASAEADAWRGAPGEADFNRRGRLWPTVGLGCRMNSASRGLRPMVGLRRPEKASLRRRRPTPGAERLERPISIGAEAFGRWSAYVPNEFGLQRPSADGRPARRMNSASRGLWPAVGLRRPEKASLRRRRPTPGA